MYRGISGAPSRDRSSSPGPAAFGFVPISIAGLAGVAKQAAGLASGLLNTSQRLGGAIGLAIASTVAATRFRPCSAKARLLTPR